ncbi:ABC transporter ATP-binding protein [Aminiphilus circumscriptus]|jgi:oligopeptide/dipeptide ABC transporter ATP-binding protein|uniref:ABC transporter ATP-binding protein n=1 Tax=Aminiphilus circumscriptus TaxID=290732 RepID=UPI0004923EC8|nr:ABC transporter ATP-binding protein [Aminiphilus circumscriptus]
MPLLEVKGLKTYFDTDRGVIRAVDGVSLSIEAGQTLGVVGESGCGKSVTALSILRLVHKPVGRIAGGEILFDGKNLLTLSEQEMRSVRGNRISMIFQEPMTSLNPVYTVGEQIMEPLMQHQRLDKNKARKKAEEMLDLVGIPGATRRLDEYPHQFSGGQRQRIMIAMALACNPGLLIADEPTTALDVTVQAQILDLMNDLKKEFGSSILLITHALGVIAETAQRVVVMYAARVVEEADVEALFHKPLHPYTKGLLHSIPRLDEDRERLDVIPGVVPNPLDFPEGCRFHNRCSFCFEKCRMQEPPLFLLKGGRSVRCWLCANDPDKVGERHD